MLVHKNGTVVEADISYYSPQIDMDMEGNLYFTHKGSDHPTLNHYELVKVNSSGEKISYDFYDEGFHHSYFLVGENQTMLAYFWAGFDMPNGWNTYAIEEENLKFLSGLDVNYQLFKDDQGTIYYSGYDNYASFGYLDDSSNKRELFSSRDYPYGSIYNSFRVSIHNKRAILFNKNAFVVVGDKKGWEKENGKWVYYNGIIGKQKGWLKDNGKWYFFNDNGEMITGHLIYDRQKRYYLDAEGVMSTGWIIHQNNWYFADAQGIIQTGWVKKDNKWYYFITSPGPLNGRMETGWLNENGDWYYLQSNGMRTGWLYEDGEWYFLEDNGAMKTGWKLYNSEWYYLKSTGEMKTGWTLYNGDWYYLNSSGVMKTGWLYDQGKWYFLNSAGDMETGWKKIESDWYYFYSDGEMASSTYIGKYRVSNEGAWVH
ncbi:hypothetical protein A6P54_12640 [Bacillus sp. MKU004]|nr:hypothetical protein A6P54_12640 [Bacillus sp. MKU004]